MKWEKFGTSRTFQQSSPSGQTVAQEVERVATNMLKCHWAKYWPWRLWWLMCDRGSAAHRRSVWMGEYDLHCKALSRWEDWKSSVYIHCIICYCSQLLTCQPLRSSWDTSLSLEPSKQRKTENEWMNCDTHTCIPRVLKDKTVAWVTVMFNHFENFDLLKANHL